MREWNSNKLWVNMDERYPKAERNGSVLEWPLSSIGWWMSVNYDDDSVNIFRLLILCDRVIQTLISRRISFSEAYWSLCLLPFMHLLYTCNLSFVDQIKSSTEHSVFCRQFRTVEMCQIKIYIICENLANIDTY